jgi:hypothetical protein
MQETRLTADVAASLLVLASNSCSLVLRESENLLLVM